MILRFLLLLPIALSSRGAEPPAPSPAVSSALESILNFEASQPGGMPVGWRGGPKETISIDHGVIHRGMSAAKIDRGPASPEPFTSLTNSVPIDFAGSQIELRGYLRMENVSEFAGLWLREDGADGSLEFDNMQRRQLKGTADWKQYSVTLRLNPSARKLVFGALLAGTGRIWADDLELLVDGKPVWEAPKAPPPQLTVLDRDREFADGSKIVLDDLSPVQIANLATLGKVWGFLKYHHPKVVTGEVHWDFELFRVLPGLLGARDAATANAILVRWIDGLGGLSPGGAVPPGEADYDLRADLQWTGDEARLGKELCSRLRAVYAARPAVGRQFYVSLVPNVGNPVFEHEFSYPSLKLPDAGYQLLGLFRFWNIIRYWAPYRDLVEGDWNATLTEFMPRIGLAKNRDTYEREFLALIARVSDTHANLWSSLRSRPPVGDGILPVTIRFVEGKAVVTDRVTMDGGTLVGLKRGDVIDLIDGRSVEELTKDWLPFFAASNEPTRLRDIARSLGRGPVGPVKLRVRRGNETLEIEDARILTTKLPPLGKPWHDLPGPAFRLLSKDVAYLKLSSVKKDASTSYVEEASGTKGLIIDLRNYPSEFVVFALGSHFVDKPTAFVRFTVGSLVNPGQFCFGQPLVIAPQAPHYSGRIVILVDEDTLSQAEYTAMAFRVSPGAIVVGSTTAGADGNVSPVPLPGGLKSAISGIGVFYPDKRPTQRIGIVPDVVTHPTLAGIRAGRDVVLEEGLRQILGAHTSAEEIRKLIPLRE